MQIDFEQHLKELVVKKCPFHESASSAKGRGCKVSVI